MTSRDMYSFEYSSGSTWGAYLVPADSYNLHIDSKGKVSLSCVVPTACDFDGVQKLAPAGSAQFCSCVRELLAKKPVKAS